MDNKQEAPQWIISLIVGAVDIGLVWLFASTFNPNIDSGLVWLIAILYASLQSTLGVIRRAVQ